MSTNTKPSGIRRRGSVQAAFVAARWAPALAFLTVFAEYGDLSYLACAAAVSMWPAFKATHQN
jgi:hypothetical protein